MKALLLGVLLLTSCDLVDRDRAGERGPLKILVAGQSNAVSPKNYLHGDKGSEVTIVNGSHGPSNLYISWWYLGDFIKSETGRPVEFFVVAHGGRTSQWLWDTFHAEWERVLSEEKPQIIIWIQGETDYGDGLTYEESYSAYSKIFTLFNKYLQKERIFCAISSSSPSGAPVVQVQRKIISEGLATEGVNLDAIRQSNPEYFEATGGEFDGEGLRVHALKWLRILRGQI